MTGNSQTDAIHPDAVGWRFDNSYSRLPDKFFAPATPSPVREPRIVILNQGLAAELGLSFNSLEPPAVAAVFSGLQLPAGSAPIAQAYAGHQFGHFTMLGDGRAILLGEHRTPAGKLVDVQFKGSGRTQYSRGGDGRAALGPMLREYIISEAMAALGIPSTRSLAVVTTGEPVYRETVRRGAILTRIASSHLRVGTFEYAAALRDPALLRTFADYAIARHDPELSDAPDKYFAFFQAVCDRQAALVARWQLVGFIHGVMNTDNVSIAGETIDYGPCAFMDVYNINTVFSSIDQIGRYAFGRQPVITQWNLARFAESILPLLDEDEPAAVAKATTELEAFPARFERYWQAGMRAKLGLQTVEADDESLIRTLLDWMQTAGVDFTNTFRDLSTVSVCDAEPYRQPAFQSWHERWRQRLGREGRSPNETAASMRAVNPAVIPRNHRVEEALTAAEEHDDYSVLHRLLAVLSRPFEETAETVHFREPSPDAAGYRTFCGT